MMDWLKRKGKLHIWGKKPQIHMKLNLYTPGFLTWYITKIIWEVFARHQKAMIDTLFKPSTLYNHLKKTGKIKFH